MWIYLHTTRCSGSFTQSPYTCAAAVGTRDCLTERLKAEDLDRRDPESGIFVPKCVPPEEAGEGADGRVLYRRAQCHKSTGYCWCVEQESGTPIPRTSTHNIMPDCENIRVRLFKGITVCASVCLYSHSVRLYSTVL